MCRVQVGHPSAQGVWVEQGTQEDTGLRRQPGKWHLTRCWRARGFTAVTESGGGAVELEPRAQSWDLGWVSARVSQPFREPGHSAVLPTAPSCSSHCVLRSSTPHQLSFYTVQGTSVNAILFMSSSRPCASMQGTSLSHFFKPSTKHFIVNFVTSK